MNYCECENMFDNNIHFCYYLHIMYRKESTCSAVLAKIKDSNKQKDFYSQNPDEFDKQVGII